MTLVTIARNLTRKKDGITLIEAVFALGTWLIISAGVLFLWHHVVNEAARILESQQTLENARVAMDVMVANIEFSHHIHIQLAEDGRFHHMQFEDIGWAGVNHQFTLRFQPLQGILLFGENELAGHIQDIYMAYTPEQTIAITLYTTGDHPLRLHRVVDIRGKAIYF